MALPTLACYLPYMSLILPSPCTKAKSSGKENLANSFNVGSPVSKLEPWMSGFSLDARRPIRHLSMGSS